MKPFWVIAPLILAISTTISSCSYQTQTSQKPGLLLDRVTANARQYASSKFPDARIERATVIISDHGSSWLAQISPESPYYDQQGREIHVLDGDLWVLIDKNTEKPFEIYELRRQVPS